MGGLSAGVSLGGGCSEGRSLGVPEDHGTFPHRVVPQGSGISSWVSPWGQDFLRDGVSGAVVAPEQEV